MASNVLSSANVSDIPTRAKRTKAVFKELITLINTDKYRMKSDYYFGSNFSLCRCLWLQFSSIKENQKSRNGKDVRLSMSSNSLYT